MEYLRHLTETEKINFSVSGPTFENLKYYFISIAETLEEKSDYLTLGYLIYFTQQFNTNRKNLEKIEKKKNLENTGNPFDDDDEEDSQGNEIVESLYISDLEMNGSKGNEPELVYLAEEYYQIEALQNKEFWKKILGQFFSVNFLKK